MKKYTLIMILGMGGVLSITGCSSLKVKRVDVKEPIDISGRWNDTDSRLVSEAMIDDCLRRPWYTDFSEANNRKPVVIVGEVINRTHEHINAEVFTKDLERSLINSGRVKFVASKGERIQIREERDSQQMGYTNKETIKRIGMETGADFIIIGSINSIKDEFKNRYVILYQTNLELVDIENNEKVWIGQNSVKKVVTRSKFSL
jgi:penicillin-binding protein activator